MNWTFATLVSDSYVDATMTLIYSLLKRSGIRQFNFTCMHSERWCFLSPENMIKIKKKYPFVEFVLCDETPYDMIDVQSAAKCYGNQCHERKFPEYGAKTWLLKFETMRLLGAFDRVIWLDSDVICVGNITQLLKVKNWFAVTIRENDCFGEITYKGRKINAGVMLLGGNLLTLDVWREIVKMRIDHGDKYPNGDQMVWQEYFKGKKLFSLGKKYNDFPSNYSRSKLIHYFGIKPWEIAEEKATGSDKFWYNIYNEMIKS